MKKIIYIITAFAFILLPFITEAHVRYIANDEEVSLYSGYDWNSFFSPLNDSFNLFLILIHIVAVLVLYLLIPRLRRICKWCLNMEHRLEEYKAYIPGLIRITVAISLIGAGTGMYFISPVLEANDALASLQILIGFMIFLGILIEPLTLITIFLFILALSEDLYLAGSFDLLALLFVMLTLDARKPGLDDIIGIKDYINFNFLKDYAGFILRFGIGFSMIVLALYEKILNPHLAEFVVRVTDLTNVVPVSEAMWVFGAGTIELIIGVLLLIGFKTRIVSTVAFVVLSLSFFYFGEDVTSHITLFGILGAILILGPGKLSLDHCLNKKKFS